MNADNPMAATGAPTTQVFRMVDSRTPSDAKKGCGCGGCGCGGKGKRAQQESVTSQQEASEVSSSRA